MDAVPTLAAAAGSVRLGERDVAGLLVRRHVRRPYDLLAAALGVRPDRLRGIVTRWRHRCPRLSTGRFSGFG